MAPDLVSFSPSRPDDPSLGTCIKQRRFKAGTRALTNPPGAACEHGPQAALLPDRERPHASLVEGAGDGN